MDMKENIKTKAHELKMVRDKALWTLPKVDQWEELAKNVLSCEIKARIEELEPYENKPVGDTIYKNHTDYRIAELKDQLQSLDK